MSDYDKFIEVGRMIFVIGLGIGSVIGWYLWSRWDCWRHHREVPKVAEAEMERQKKLAVLEKRVEVLLKGFGTATTTETVVPAVKDDFITYYSAERWSHLSSCCPACGENKGMGSGSSSSVDGSGRYGDSNMCNACGRSIKHERIDGTYSIYPVAPAVLERELAEYREWKGAE